MRFAVTLRGSDGERIVHVNAASGDEAARAAWKYGHTVGGVHPDAEPIETAAPVRQRRWWEIF